MVGVPPMAVPWVFLLKAVSKNRLSGSGRPWTRAASDAAIEFLRFPLRFPPFGGDMVYEESCATTTTKV